MSSFIWFYCVALDCQKKNPKEHKYKSRQRRCSLKKGGLKNFAKFARKHLSQSFFKKKLQASSFKLQASLITVPTILVVINHIPVICIYIYIFIYLTNMHQVQVFIVLYILCIYIYIYIYIYIFITGKWISNVYLVKFSTSLLSSLSTYFLWEFIYKRCERQAMTCISNLRK